MDIYKKIRALFRGALERLRGLFKGLPLPLGNDGEHTIEDNGNNGIGVLGRLLGLGLVVTGCRHFGYHLSAF